MDGNSMRTLHYGSFSLLQICFQYTDVKKGLPGANNTYFGGQFSRNQFLRCLCSEHHHCSTLYPPGWVGKPKFSVLQVHFCKWGLFFSSKNHVLGTGKSNWEAKSDQHLCIWISCVLILCMVKNTKAFLFSVSYEFNPVY